MSKPLKPRRGTTAEQNAFVGEAYEITYDTDKNTLVCRDGVTPGGFPLAKSAELEAFKTSQATRDTAQDAAINAAQTAASNAQSTANTAKSGADTANAAVAGLATVAKTGSYTDLKDKPAIPATPYAYITYTWSSGEAWYRRWSDGWIEQGGVCPVKASWHTNTFWIPFSNTNYTIVATTLSGVGTNLFADPVSIARRSSTQFDSAKNNGAEGYYATWYACGY